MRGLLVGLLLLPAGGAAAQCFDLRAVVAAPLREPPAGRSADGATQDGRVWASLVAELHRPITDVLRLLRDPARTPDPSVDELQVEALPPGPHLSYLRLRSVVRPFPLITVEWTEELAIDLLAGSAAAPEVVLISYQKTEGTSHIAHLCGSTLLTRLEPGRTRIYQYEESKITGRGRRDQATALANFLELLRAKL